MPEQRIAHKLYTITGYAQIEAADDEEALRKFEEAGLGIRVEVAEGVIVDFEGPWDEIEEIYEPECICPPELVAAGGFRGGCPVHG